jgi:hypothetical protein
MKAPCRLQKFPTKKVCETEDSSDGKRNIGPKKIREPFRVIFGQIEEGRVLFDEPDIDAFQRGGEQFLLSAEIGVDSFLINPGGARDPVYPAAVEAEARKLLYRRLEDFPPRFLGRDCSFTPAIFRGSSSRVVDAR